MLKSVNAEIFGTDIYFASDTKNLKIIYLKHEHQNPHFHALFAIIQLQLANAQSTSWNIPIN